MVARRKPFTGNSELPTLPLGLPSAVSFAFLFSAWLIYDHASLNYGVGMMTIPGWDSITSVYGPPV